MISAPLRLLWLNGDLVEAHYHVGRVLLVFTARSGILAKCVFLKSKPSGLTELEQWQSTESNAVAEFVKDS